MSIDSVRNFIAQDISAVDEVIRQKLYSQVALIRQISEYIINNGGKRLRPALVILSAGVFGYAEKYHHQLADVVEFIHTATLLHDDVVDESELRRNNATANADCRPCCCTQCGLVTNNLRDFAKYPGLQSENWIESP